MALRPVIPLHGTIEASTPGEPRVLRLSDGTGDPGCRGNEVLWIPTGADESVGVAGFAAVARPGRVPTGPGMPPLTFAVSESMSYLGNGDIVRVDPSNRTIHVLYRKSSRFNSLLVTERCNSYCVMCSQPPKARDDGFLVDELLAAIPLMSRESGELGITGGEPTLLGDRLLELLTALRDHLPATAVHMLSNGRLFAYLERAVQLARIEHPDLVVAVPLYSDLPWGHDFVVQARGAFDQTIRGLLNLGRMNQRIEVRVVLHKHTIPRLPHLARFIARNLPFVEHVAFMGLELMGHVKVNLDALWVDPVDYQAALVEATQLLHERGVVVSIYNLPLCVADPTVRSFARQSISDWKNVFVEACESCAARPQCGGFFGSSALKSSRGVRPLSVQDLPVAAC